MSEQEKKPRKTFFEPWDGEYIGNIWGWKVSFIGLAVIILLSLWVAYGPRTEPADREEIEIITPK